MITSIINLSPGLQYKLIDCRRWFKIKYSTFRVNTSEPQKPVYNVYVPESVLSAKYKSNFRRKIEETVRTANIWTVKECYYEQELILNYSSNCSLFGTEGDDQI